MPEFEVEGLTGLREIGRGGFGVVYRATETDLGRTVAVKVLSYGSVEESNRRLDRERKAMGVLSGHPNVVTIYRSGIAADGSAFLVMEFLEGGTLEQRLAHYGPRPWTEVTELGVALSGVLESAHRAGVLHRDIKPANILFSGNGVAKLADFGIANVESVSNTSGVVKATIGHAPPEILHGHQPTGRSDTYALASTLYELLSGRPAFVRTTDTAPAAIIARIMTQPVVDLDPRTTPPELNETLKRAMAKDPAHRQPTVEDFGSELQAVRHRYQQPPAPITISGAKPTPRTTDTTPIVPVGFGDHLSGSTPNPPPTPALARPQPPPGAAPTAATRSKGPRVLLVGLVALALLLAGSLAAVIAVRSGQPDAGGTASGGQTEPSNLTTVTSDPELSDPELGETTTSTTIVPVSEPTDDDANRDRSAADNTEILRKIVVNEPLDLGEAQDYADYEPFTNESGTITVQTPVAWLDRETSIVPGIDSLLVATNLNLAAPNESVAAISVVAFVVPTAASGGPTVSESLTGATSGANVSRCTAGPQIDVTHESLTEAKYQILSECQGGGEDLVVTLLVGNWRGDDTVRVLIQTQVIGPSSQDLLAIEHIAASVDVRFPGE